MTLDKEFFSQYGDHFHNANPQDPSACIDLLKSSPTITYLHHEFAKIRLKSPAGPHTEFSVFGSPYSPRFGHWAFYYDAPQASSACPTLPSLWKDIPLNTDIVVTHTPPRAHCDETRTQVPGCEALRQALWRVRPRLAVCGHIHEARGAERVIWDLDCRHSPYAEKSTIKWVDSTEGTKKLSLVDLTGKKGPSLVNDGSHPTSSTLADKSEMGRLGSDDLEGSSDLPQLATASPSPSAAVDARIPVSPPAVGLGGDPTSGRCDREALVGRMGRKETCVVNAALMKSRFPHTGGKVLNKPIIVDINLPVWVMEDEE